MIFVSIKMLENSASKQREREKKMEAKTFSEKKVGRNTRGDLSRNWKKSGTSS